MTRPPDEARQADVRQRGERQPVAAHLLERLERRQQAAAVVRADRSDVERRAAARPPRARATPASVSAPSSNVISATIGSVETLAHGGDRVDELLEVVERLDHEQVGAAPLEHARLLAVELLAHPRGRRLAERADRAGDEDVAARDLPGLAGELDRRRVDPLEVVLEEVVGELAPVRAERVRLDQLGAGVDEADVQRDDRLGRPEVGLLGRAQPGDGGRDQRAHAAVGDDRRALPAGAA